MAARYHPAMSAQPPARSSLRLATVLLLAPALVGALTAWSGAPSPAAALVLWVEPVLFFLVVHGLAWLLWERRWMPALGLATGALLAGTILRVPPVADPPTSTEAPWARALRGCTKLPESVRSPVRVLTWTLDAGPVDLSVVEDRHVDLAILSGLHDPSAARALADRIHGEALILPATDTSDSLALVVRGAFQYCQGHDDSWEVPLPVEAGERARAVLTFPEVQGAGVVPFLAVQMQGLGELSTWPGWSERLVQGARQLGDLTHALGPRRMVIAGDFGAPRTFRALASPLLGAGLREVPVPASWPAPLVGLHALDRVWTGGAWQPLATARLPAHGHSRTPVVVDLAPAEAHAR